MDFGELRNDEDFKDKVTNLTNALENINTSIDSACKIPNYDELTTEEKVKFDLYLSYSINSLFWTLCKLQAIDPATHGIGNEISRVRQAMVRDKKLEEHRTIRPVLDVGAAGRFIRHGLYDPKKRPTDREYLAPKPQKRKFDDDDD